MTISFHSEVMACLLRVFLIDISAVVDPDCVSARVKGLRTSSFDDDSFMIVFVISALMIVQFERKRKAVKDEC